MTLFVPRFITPDLACGNGPRSRALAVFAVTALTASLWLAPVSVRAQNPPASVPAADTRKSVALSFAIPGGPLESVLNRFGREAGVLISYSTATTAGLQSQGLQGSYTVADGLARILQGSGLEAMPQAGGFVVRRMAMSSGAAESLPAISVKAAGADNVTEGSGSYGISVMNTATRLALAPRETPQSVSVVTRQQIEDRNVQSMEDLTSMATGLNLSLNSYERASLYSRGFPISFFLQDGMPSSADSDSMGLATLAMVDHVEVLRGAAGILTGVGEPSGVINLVRKRPTADTQVALTTSAGSWHDYRTELDASGALNEARTLRGRGVVAYQDADTFMNNYRHRRLLLYGTVDADLTRDTTLSLGASYNQENNPGSSWYGLPTSADGSFLPVSRSLNTAPDWTYWNKATTRVFAELESRLDNGWKLKAAAQATRDVSDSLLTGTAASGLADNLFTLYAANTYHYVRTQKGVELQASGPFMLGGRKHELVFGASYRTRDVNDIGATAAGGYSYTFDALTWDGSDAPRPTEFTPSYSNVTRTQQTGLYGMARFALSDPLALLAGARLDWYDYQGVTNNLGTITPTSYGASHKFTPYLGLTYDLTPASTLYTSWTSVFNPQSGVDANGRVLDPITGTNSEAGIKSEFFGGALNVSAAVFRIRQRNLPLTLDASACQASSACYVASGEVASSGYEMEVVGALTDAWQISAGFTFANARLLSDADSGSAGSRYAPDTQPARVLHVSTMYHLPRQLSQWRVGGTLRTQSAIYSTQTPVVRQGGYTVVDLMAGWQATSKLDLRLSLNNLFDKQYYLAVYNTVSGNTFGAPRNAVLTARYKF